MKTVGGYDFVIQTWIKQEQSSAHTPKVYRGMQDYSGTRMFFEGTTIYSYHDWWPAARILPGKKALLTRNVFSATTTAHTNQIESALLRADYKVFPVYSAANKPDPSFLLERFRNEFESAKRARDRLAWEHVGLHSLKRARLAYLEFCREFGFPVEFDLTKEDWKALAQRVKLYYDRRQAKQFAKKLLHGKECYA